jgi:hypothetical protein
VQACCAGGVPFEAAALKENTFSTRGTLSTVVHAAAGFLFTSNAKNTVASPRCLSNYLFLKSIGDVFLKNIDFKF